MNINNVKRTKFDSPADFLKSLYEGNGYYSPTTGEYFFAKTGEASIKVHHLSAEGLLNSVATLAAEEGKAWQNYLDVNGHSAVSYEGADSFNLVIAKWNGELINVNDITKEIIREKTGDSIRKGITTDALKRAFDYNGITFGYTNLGRPYATFKDMGADMPKLVHTCFLSDSAAEKLTDTRNIDLFIKTLYDELYSDSISMGDFNKIKDYLDNQLGIDLPENHYHDKETAARDSKNGTFATIGAGCVPVYMYNRNDFAAKNLLNERVTEAVRGFFGDMFKGSPYEHYDYMNEINFDSYAGVMRDYVETMFTKDTGINLVVIDDYVKEETLAKDSPAFIRDEDGVLRYENAPEQDYGDDDEILHA